MAALTKKEIAKLLNLTPRKIQFLVDIGVIIPDISPKTGRGNALLFSDRNFVELTMVKILQWSGFSLDTIRSMFSALRQGKVPGVNWEEFLTRREWGDERELVYWEGKPSSKPLAGSDARFYALEHTAESGFAVIKKGEKFCLPTFNIDRRIMGYQCVMLSKVKESAETELMLA